MIKDEISKYKKKTIEMLISNDDFITLIDEPEITDNDPSELVYNNIFMFKRIPSTQEEVKAFVLISVDIPRVSTANYFFMEVLLTVAVVCHSGKMKTDYGGTRADLLAASVNNILNGTKAFNGKRLELVSDIEGVLTGGAYFYRELRFAAGEINNVQC